MRIGDVHQEKARRAVRVRPARGERSAWTLLCVAAALCLAGEATSWAQSNPAPSGSPAGHENTDRGPKDDVKHAEQLAERGDKTFAAGKMNEALAAYEQAVKAAPGNAGIVRRAAAVRARAVQALVNQAEMAAVNGQVRRATALMYQALEIDPGNTIVAERLAQMKQMKEYLPPGDKADDELKGPLTLKPQTGKKAVNVRGDSKSAYEQVGGMFGISVAFDPDLASQNIKLRVNDV